METKELIFNGKKFFEGVEPNYIGKNIVLPEKKCKFIYFSVRAGTGDVQDITLNMGCQESERNYDWSHYKGLKGQIVSQISGIAIADGSFDNYEELTGTHRTLVLARFPQTITSPSNDWLDLSDVLQNGGVSASYIITLCSTRKELVA